MARTKSRALLLIGVLLIGAAGIYIMLFPEGLRFQRAGNRGLDSNYAGTLSCRECHEEFYQLWAPSHHGLAMQPFTADLFQARLTTQNEAIEIQGTLYRVEFDGETGWVRETLSNETERYPMVHALGGKNVYYFLTPFDRGRLQVLPLAYDVRRKVWFDTAASGVRHFREIEEDPIDWRAQEYTFNTSCYSCHVSQLTQNYDLETDSYHTTWREPGINCEACHGSAVEHVRVCREAADGQIPEDLKIDVISSPRYSKELASEACVFCHAKAAPLSVSVRPGDRFFDHFDPVTLENPDYYPDGRDLGENYTFTQWLMSPCARSGQLDCLHCHTSSGRYRFQGEEINNACLPCHSGNVANAAGHSHHPKGSKGSQCVSCHMPMTEFARMNRSDHSMLPPVPSATIAYESPNACNICHQDRDAAWADQWVRQWRKRDYQAPLLQRASLIAAARQQDWLKLPAMLEYLSKDGNNEVFAASLIRLLRHCDDERKWPLLIHSINSTSPLVRASAAQALGDRIDNQTIVPLLNATRDESRLVRVRAAAALAPISPGSLDSEAAQSLDSAINEYKVSLNARPDHWSSHYNIGNFQLARRDYQSAASSYETAIRLHPGMVLPYVNASLAYNALNQNDRAEQSLRRAVDLEPENFAANFNFGLLLGEQGRFSEAEVFLQTAARLDPGSAPAAYNLGIVVAESGRIGDAIDRFRQAYRLQPAEPKYGFTLAFYQRQNGNATDAIRTLEELVGQQKSNLDCYMLLADIYQQQGKTEDAVRVYKKAFADKNLSAVERQRLESMIEALQAQ